MEIMSSSYDPPLALTVIASLFIGLAGLVSIWIAWDILVRRGWRSMMGVMLPVYVLNALYLAPITLWTYLKYGRPMTLAILKKWIEKSSESGADGNDMSGHMHIMQQKGSDGERRDPGKAPPHEGNGMRIANEDTAQHNLIQPDSRADDMNMKNEPGGGEAPSEHNHETHIISISNHMRHEGLARHENPEGMDSDTSHLEHQQHDHEMPGSSHMHHMDMEHERKHPAPKKAGHVMSHMNHNIANDPHMFHMMQERPMFATVTVAVCHCGAGCLLGDIVGEWLVYGTNAQINGKSIWPEFLIDYAFALLIGIIFQYFSIAPMSGNYGPKTIYRAAKADFLSLTFFEIGLFGWMAIFQIAIFDWELQTNNVVYWWMMQIGMFLGHWTAFPINWWLITSGIKEPCA